jgi:hypothetical protein
MAKKSGNSPENEGEPAAPGSSSDAAAAPLTPRLSVQLDDHGAIAWERMRPDTRDKLQAALQKSGTPTGDGARAATATVVDSFPPAMAETIYDSLSMLLTGLARRGGYTQDQAAVLAFDGKEKASLIPATCRVLDKYNTSLGKYQEEIVLGVLLTTIVSGKLALLKKSAQVIHMAPNTGETGSQGES